MEVLHGPLYVGGVLPVLLSGLDRLGQLLRDRLPQVIGQLLGAGGQVLDRTGDDPADLLDVSGGLPAGPARLINFRWPAKALPLSLCHVSLYYNPLSPKLQEEISKLQK